MRLISTTFYFLFGCLIVLNFSACSPNNITIQDSYKSIFDSANVEGCYTMFENGSGQFYIYNIGRYKDSTYSPASTFNLINSLIGIETGRIVNEKTIFKWDGKSYHLPNGDTAFGWNKDLSMAEAFKVGSFPYFQQVARSIGRDTMQFWIDSIPYGNKKIAGAIDSFWMNNTLRVSADEQLGLVKRLYFNQLSFQKRTQTIVKKQMVQEDNDKYKLSYTTGWGIKENGKGLAWIMGWIEENRHVYFFVINIEGDAKQDLPTISKGILTNILKKEEFFEGKR